MTREELLQWEKERREKNLQASQKEQLYQQENLLRAKSLPLILNTDETVDEKLFCSPAEAARLRRKEAKLKADAEQRWMVFVFSFVTIGYFFLIMTLVMYRYLAI